MLMPRHAIKKAKKGLDQRIKDQAVADYEERTGEIVGPNSISLLANKMMLYRDLQWCRSEFAKSLARECRTLGRVDKAIRAMSNSLLDDLGGWQGRTKASRPIKRQAVRDDIRSICEGILAPRKIKPEPEPEDTSKKRTKKVNNDRIDPADLPEGLRSIFGAWEG